ncbi:MAG: NUDIX hydrolase [Chloroflexi bacterium]|nr:NUDIX hydrolase [Chloroflexota bacterium]
MEEEPQAVAVPRDAATLILMRNGGWAGHRLEILMLRRHSKSAFLPGAYVFPGGRVEVADCGRDAEGLCHGITPQQAQIIIDGATPPERALGFFVTAIREAFEEAGILLAYRESPDLMAINEDEKTRFSQYRQQVQKDPSSFAAMVRSEGVTLAADRLFYFAHWITPEIVPIRFDTRFFVAAAPPGQEALFDALETTDSLWITPQEVLEKRRKDELDVPFPTFCNVKTLAEFSSVDEVISSTVGKEVPCIQPLLDMLSLG